MSFFSFSGVKKHVIFTLLHWILSVPSRSASVSYAGSVGSDTMSRIRTFHFVTSFLQVNHLWKDTFGQECSVRLSCCGYYKINEHSQM